MKALARCATSAPYVLAVITFALSCAAHAQAPACRVLDPELAESYTGGCKDGLAEGFGEARGVARYSGELKAGRPHGKGIKTWPTGDRYEGDFVEGRKEGTGMYTWGRRSPWAGQRYTGGFLYDMRDGYGVYEWPKGERYVGEWKNDRFLGQPTRGTALRARSQAELVAAVGRVGAKVCREIEAGVGVLDILRGTVTKVQGETVSVRIDQPGKADHTIGGIVVKKGMVVTEPLRGWLPCQ